MSICSACGSSEAYVSLISIECPNRSCRYYTEKQEQESLKNKYPNFYKELELEVNHPNISENEWDDEDTKKMFKGLAASYNKFINTHVSNDKDDDNVYLDTGATNDTNFDFQQLDFDLGIDTPDAKK